MSSSTPLNSHPQDAVAGHNAKSGIGGVQHAGSGKHGEQQLIALGYVPMRQLSGKVVGVWGDAHVRLLDGSVVPLHAGDVVKKGEVVLTSQDGIVQIEAAHTHLAGASPDVERVISQVGQGDADVVPAAGPNSGGAAGSLEEGLRVDRDAESTTPGSLAFNPQLAPTQPTQAEGVAPLVPLAPLATPPVANPDTETTAVNTPVAFDPRANDSSGSGLAIVAVGGHPIDPNTPVTLPQGTIAMNPDGSLTFTPNPGFNGSISFTYTDQNASGETATSTVTVTVGNPNDHQPVAVADTFAGVEDTAITGSLASNDTPSADGGNVWSLATGAAHGSVTVNADGTFSYVPAAHYSGADSFTYTITDADGSTSSTTVTLNVAPVDHAPAAANDAYPTNEGTPLVFDPRANDTDADGDALKITQINGTPIDATHPATLPEGVVSMNADGTLTFTPNANYNGPVAFAYTVDDGHGGTSTATVDITVIPVNDAPVAHDDTVSAGFGTPVTIAVLGNDTDANGDPLTVTQVAGQPIIAGGPAIAVVVAGVTEGSVTLDTSGHLTFTPAPGYTGPASFSYTVDDGHGGTSTATVDVTVDTPPVANADSYASAPGATLVLDGAAGSANASLTANDSDANAGDTLAVTRIDGHAIAAGGSVAVANGTVSMDASGVVSFTPASAAYHGQTSFQYTVDDGHGGTASATATITVAPAAIADNANVDFDTPKVIDVLANDKLVDGDNVSVATVAGHAISVGGTPVDIVSGAGVHEGTVALNADGTLTFTPGAGVTGPVSFAYTVTDGTSPSAPATVSLVIDTPPVAVADSYTDAPGATLVLDGAAGSANASLTANDTDTDAGSTLSVTQIDGHAIVAGGSVAVANGTVSMDAIGVVSFTPASAGFHGQTSFQYTVSDGHGGTSSASAAITVAPVTVADNGRVDFDTPRIVDVLANDRLVDGNHIDVATVAGHAISVGGTPVDIVSGTGAHEGTVALNADGTLTFTPDAGLTGPVSFTYTITDGTSQSAPATVSLTVDTPPVAAADAYADVQGATLVLNGPAGSANAALTANDTDADGTDTLTVTTIGTTAIAAGGSVAVANGTVSMDAAGVLSFTPSSATFHGATSFQYTVSDGHGGTSTATATITIAPTAVADNGNVDFDTPKVIDVLANDKLVDGNNIDVATVAGHAISVGGTPVDIVSSGGVHQGTVALNADGTLTFTPDAGVTGPVSFAYTVTDGTTQSAATSVNLVVDTPPVAGADDYAQAMGATLVLDGAKGSANAALTANDTDVDAGDTLTVTQIDGHAIAAGGSIAVANGTVSMDAIGVVSFTPSPASYHGATSFQYTVSDGHGGTATATATIDVAPTAVADTALVDFDTPKTIDVLANDKLVDGGNVSVATVAGHAIAVGGTPVDIVSSGGVHQGTVGLNADGTLTFTPDTGITGAISFAYTVTDGSSQSAPATVSLTVDTPPVAVADGYADAMGAPLVLDGAKGSANASLTANDTDVDTADTLTITQIGTSAIAAGGVVAVSNGTVAMDASGVLSFTPTAGYHGATSFQYTVSDGHGGTSTATATITIAPTAVADSARVDFDTPKIVDVLTNDKAVDGNNVHVATVAGHAIVVGGTPVDIVSSGGVHQGTVGLNADGTLTFTPDPGITGAISFAYTVTDGSSQSAPATVSLTVDTPPVAVADGYADAMGAPLVLDGAKGSANASLTANDTDVDTADTLTITQIGTSAIAAGGVVAVSNGTVAMDASGVLSFTPTAGYHGATSFQYTVSDGHGGTSTATATITIAPTAVADSARVDFDTPKIVDVLTNDKAVDGNNVHVATVAGHAIVVGGTPVDIVSGSGVHQGTVGLNADGTLTFTPDPGVTGAVSFSYTVTDGASQSVAATVNLLVDTPPVANADTYTDAMGTVLVLDGVKGSANASLTSNDTDLDATDTLTVTQIGTTAIVPGGSVAVANGTVSMDASGVVSFTPSSASYHGATSFQYTVSDGHGGTCTATATVTIAPTAVADSARVDFDTPKIVDVLTNDKAVDGNNVHVATVAGLAIAVGGTPVDIVSSGGVHQGTVGLNADGTLTFTPDPGVTGAVSFSYTVSDGTTQSAAASVSLVVDTPPVATADSYTDARATTLVLDGTINSATHSLAANDTDANPGDVLTVTRIGTTAIVPGGSVAVANGTVSMDANGIVSFTPSSSSFHGSTSFTYTVSDGHGGTSTTTATIVVNPSAVADSANVDFNAPKIVDVLANDKAVDGNNVHVATVAGLAIAVGGTPVDIVSSGGVHQGTVSLNADGTLTFTPDPGVTGAVSFAYTVTDGTSQSPAATVSLTVDTPPIAVADSYTDTPGATLVLNGAVGSANQALTANDTDANVGDVLTVIKIGTTAIAAGGSVAVANGTVSMDANGVVSFTPSSSSFHGVTSFQYTVSDGHGGTSIATATITVAPAAVADSALVDFNTPKIVDVLTNDKAVDGNNIHVATVAGHAITVGGAPVAIVSSGGVHQGIVSLNADGTLTFTPDTGVTGAVSFSYTVTDGTSQSAPATVSLTVDTPPVANADVYTDTMGATLVLNGAPASTTHSLTSNDTDVNTTDTLTVTRIGSTAIVAGGSVAVANGTVSESAAGVISFAPTAGYHGATSFQYTISDGHGGTSTATATITVAPTAVADNALVDFNTPKIVDVLTNDKAVDGNSTPINVATVANHAITVGGPPVDIVSSGGVHQGIVSLNADGTLTFTPDSGVTGAVSFSYTVTDGTSQSAPATVSLTVDTPPVANADTYNDTMGTPLVLDGAKNTANASLTSNDIDVNTTDTLTVTKIGTTAIAAGGSVAVADGTVSMDAGGIVSFTPAAGYHGATSFQYTVSDGHGGTSTATATVTVAPTAVADNALVDFNTPKIVDVLANDKAIDGNNVNVATVAGHAITVGGAPVNIVSSGGVHQGTVSLNADGTLTFTPDTGVTGPVSFSYTVTDGASQSAPATVSLTVDTSPVANADVYTDTMGATLVLNGAPASTTHSLTSNDTDVNTTDTLTVTRIGTSAIAPGASVAVANGSVSMDANGIVSFTPSSASFHGATSFQYTVSDGHGGTATATATVTIAPTAVADNGNVDFNTPQIVDVLTNDKTVDGNNINVATVAGHAITVGGAPVDIVSSGGLHQGIVSLNADGTLTFTPDPGVTGPVTFSYTVTDGTSQSAPATVSLTVDTPPVANPDTYTDQRGVTLVLNGTPASTTHALTSNDTDVDSGDTLTVTKINGTPIAAGGSVAVTSGTVSMDSGGIVSFTPSSPNFTGATSFTYTVYDGHGGTSTAIATVNVAAGNTAPIANADTYTTTENTLLTFNGAAGSANHALTTNDTDANGDTLTVTQVNGVAIDATHPATVVVGGVTEGTVIMNSDGSIAFDPASNYTGNAAFNYTISDGHGGTATAGVSITVAAGADIPSVTANAVGRWLFNEGSGTTTTDAYHAYTGTLTNVNMANGGTLPTWITGHNGTAGTALNFDGKGGVVSVPMVDTAVLNTTSSLSVWFKTTQVGTTAGWSSPSIIGSEHIGDANDIQWGSINSKGQIGLGLGNDPTGVYSTAAVNDGNWHDLTVTRTVNTDGTSLVSVYVDGALSNSATLAAQAQIIGGVPFDELAGFGYTNAWSGTPTTAADGTSGDVYFKGSIDDARIYSHALTADQAKAVFLVENGYETQAVANDGEAIKLNVADTNTTALHVTGVETGMTISDGTHTITSTGNAQSIDLAGWNLGALQLTNVGTGSATLEFDATNTTASGQTHDSSAWVSVVNGTSLLGGTAGNDTLTATTSSATFISGGAGNDTITGGAGNDRLLGGTGDDTISGGAGNDLIVGGTGTNTLTGGAGNDVFRWEFGDHGTAGAPTVDTITDFSSVAGNKDVLDLRDLLGGVSHDNTTNGNISSFLHFDHSGADTIIHVSTTGGFANGYSTASEDETIVLKNVDLTAAGTQNDQQIIHQLLSNGQLHLG